MPIVTFEFEVRNAAAAARANEDVARSLKETESGATKSAAAVARLEKEHKSGIRSAESYRRALLDVAKTAEAGSNAQVAAMERLRKESQRLGQEEARLERQRRAGLFANQFRQGAGATRVNLGAASPLAGSFGRGPGQFLGAASAVGVSTLVGGAMNGLNSVGSGVIATFQRIGSVGVSALRGIATTAVATGVVISTSIGVSAFKSAQELDSLTRGLATVSQNADDLRAKLASSREIAKLPGLGLGEAIGGRLQLEASGLSDNLSGRSLMAFGNALASVGRGKEDLGEVILQLSQMSAAGKVTGDELRVIAERVPQVRQAMKAAFGTTNTAEINKMGLSVETVILGIVEQLERLPKASGGIRNTLDNLRDDVKTALEPLGIGLSTMMDGMLSGGAGGMSKLTDLLRGAGEVFAAIGNSGVAAEAIGKALSPLAGVNVSTFQEALATGAAAIAAAMAQVPMAFQIAADYSAVIGKNITAAWGFALQVAPLVAELIRGTFTAITQGGIQPNAAGEKAAEVTRDRRRVAGAGSNGPADQIVTGGLGFGFSGFLEMLQGKPGAQFGPTFLMRLLMSGGDVGSAVSSGVGAVALEGLDHSLDQRDKNGVRLGDRFAGLQLPQFSSLDPKDIPGMQDKIKALQSGFATDFESYRKRILSSITAIPDLPSGLAFGSEGPMGGANSPTASGNSALEKLLARVEGQSGTSGRTSPENFLRSLTTGGGSADFLLSGSELQRAGGGARFEDASHYATGIEREIVRFVLATLQRSGAGNPAFGGTF
jgi:tape measure domain-containing protein